MGFYSNVPIRECGEELVAIPDIFVFTDPHVYVSLGAPYGEFSPYYVRPGVLERLALAQTKIQAQCPNWRIKIFDAYRPVAVQEFMVNYTKHELAKAQNLDLNDPSNDPRQGQELMTQVYKFWAEPSLDPATPPPHSTGAAVDITLVDENNCEIDMGGEIDEISDRSIPNYYQSAIDLVQLQFDQHRHLLRYCMESAGFQQHPHEWWHFSYGDQMWCYLANLDDHKTARYGRA
jgi:zinc D-Ala-D-Ala dipeptidase